MFLIQLLTNLSLFIISNFGIMFGKSNVIIILICLEMMLLSVNLNFLLFSVYLDDVVGQIFSLMILTVAAAESAIGLSILIVYYRIKGNISMLENPILRG